TTADANGNFTFKNVTPGKSYALAVSSANGTNFYVPAIIVGGNSAAMASATPIGPGTNLGTIALSLPSGTTTASIGQPVTSQNAAGQATPVLVKFAMRQLVLDFEFTVPFPQQPTPSVTTGPDPSCDANTDCAAAQLTIPGYAAVFAGFNPNGMQFSTQDGYFVNVQGSAFQPNATTPDCTPQTSGSSFSSVV